MSDWVRFMTESMRRIEALQARINAPKRVWVRVEQDGKHR